MFGITKWFEFLKLSPLVSLLVKVSTKQVHFHLQKSQAGLRCCIIDWSWEGVGPNVSAK